MAKTAAVEVLLLQLDTGLEPPTYAHPDDAGADLRSTESFELQPGERRLVGTGVAILATAATRPSCTRVPGLPPGTGSASSTRPAPWTPATAGRSRFVCSTPTAANR